MIMLVILVILVNLTILVILIISTITTHTISYYPRLPRLVVVRVRRVSKLPASSPPADSNRLLNSHSLQWRSGRTASWVLRTICDASLGREATPLLPI